MTGSSWATRVAAALTDGARDRLVKRFVDANPGWNGAGPVDVIDVLAETDSDLDLLEPFCAGQAGALTAHPAVRHAARAVLWARPFAFDRDMGLTYEGLLRLLCLVDRDSDPTVARSSFDKTATDEELRSAADDMRDRHPAGHPRRDFWNELADLLNAAAESDPARSMHKSWRDYNRVLAIARKYRATG